MFIHIDPTGGLAVYDQIVRQVKFAVAGGVIVAGELIPSVRELARELAINPNTVARAYRQLQDDDVLESVRGRGLAVLPGAYKACQNGRFELIRSRLQEVLAEAHHSGLNKAQIELLLHEELDSVAKAPSQQAASATALPSKPPSKSTT